MEGILEQILRANPSEARFLEEGAHATVPQGFGISEKVNLSWALGDERWLCQTVVPPSIPDDRESIVTEVNTPLDSSSDLFDMSHLSSRFRIESTTDSRQ